MINVEQHFTKQTSLTRTRTQAAVVRDQNHHHNPIKTVPTLTPFWIEPEVLKTQRNLSKKLPPMESGGANWLQAVQRAVTGLMLTADEEAAAFFDQALSDHTLKTGHAPTASALHSQVFQAAILKGVPKSVVQAMETNPDLPGAEVDWW
ncbi:uncharacterized protein LOC133493838 isoform X3 [Syngnathoides biaculeatus]|uniref:uncharacterized protein LOC133493838 isoform X3 n=1 Tax=Syngnathoides biaculeatus TaxID=300417 RepID=UPI002ADE6401|nr:uncharacterized protein LOC133493838 isoform X3 [Syngnathoides biaculeatus]